MLNPFKFTTLYKIQMLEHYWAKDYVTEKNRQLLEVCWQEKYRDAIVDLPQFEQNKRDTSLFLKKSELIPKKSLSFQNQLVKLSVAFYWIVVASSIILGMAYIVCRIPNELQSKGSLPYTSNTGQGWLSIQNK